MHLNENDLRAYHDGELTGTPRLEAAAHLANCSDCQAELAAIAARAAQVQAILQSMTPSPIQARGTDGKPFSTSSAVAWRIFEQRIQEKPSMSKTFARLRPLWATLSLIAVLAVALSFPSVQALASNFLRMFRVQQVTALPLDMTSLKDARFDPTVGEALSQALAQQIKVTRPSGKPVEVANATQASEQVKFHVRVSNDPAQSVSRMTVQPGVAFEGTFNSDLVQEVLQGMGKSNLTLPAGLNGAVIKANIPDAVTTAYGTCHYTNDPGNAGASGGPSVGIGDRCLVVVQLPSPTVDTPPDLPVQKLAEIGLQVLGQSPEKAAQLAAQIDWTTTLVIPVPRGEMNSQTVKVDGVDGTLLSQISSDSSMKPTYTLVWVKNGIVYGMLGSGDPARAIALGNSLQ